MGDPSLSRNDEPEDVATVFASLADFGVNDSSGCIHFEDFLAFFAGKQSKSNLHTWAHKGEREADPKLGINIQSADGVSKEHIWPKNAQQQSF